MVRTAFNLAIGSVTVTEAVGVLASLSALVGGVDVAACSVDELRSLTSGARDGQRAIETLLMRVGVAADRLASDDDVSGASDAQGTLLGDGRRVRGSTARREAARSRTAAALGKVGAAIDRGEIGGEQVDAITRAARDLTLDQQQQLNTDELIESARSDPADVFAAKVRREAERIKGDHGLAGTKQKQAASRWRHWFDQRTGMGKIHAEFDPERYEAIVNSVEAQLTRLANQGGFNKTSNLAATAAFELLTGVASRRGGRPNLNVIVDWETYTRGAHDGSVRETCAGHPLPPESISRLACDATIQRIRLDGNGVPIDVGRRYRTATDAQWQAIRSIHRTCAWDGCDRPLAWCQLGDVAEGNSRRSPKVSHHHIHEWENGGVTDLCNLVPLCSKHHHAVHEGGWKIKLSEDRRLDIQRPDGSHHATTWPDRLRSGPQADDPVRAEGP